MAVGVPVVKFEIEWTAGTWTDVTSYTAGEQESSGAFGRPTEFDDISAGTWTVVLRNDDGRFTPNNPLSPYFPNVKENVRLRVTVTPPGGSSYVRFLGYITSLQPSFPAADGYTSIVQLDAADLLAVMNRRQMQSGWIETGSYVARLYGSWNDSFSFGAVDSSSTTTTVFENLGEVGGRATTGSAAVVPATTAAGNTSNGTDDAISEPVLSLTPAGIVGPVLKVVPGGTPYLMEFFLKLPMTGLGLGVTGLTIADFYNALGLEMFSLRVQKGATSGTVDFCFYNSQGAFDNYCAGVPFTTNVDNGTWMKVTLASNGVANGFTFSVNDSGLGAYFSYFDLTTIRRVYFGGYLGQVAKEGKQTFCPIMSIAGVEVQGSPHGVYGYYALGTPPPTTATQRFSELAGYGSQILPWRAVTDMYATAGSATITSATANFSQADVGKGITITGEYNAIGKFIRPSLVGGGTTIVSVQSSTQATMSNNATQTVLDPGVIGIIGPAVLGSDDRPVVRYNPQGQTLAEAMQLHARTIGGVMWVSNTGIPTLIYPDQVRSTTPIATIDIEGDVNGENLELRRSIDQAPTRVTVSSPVVDQAIVIDQVAEAAGYRAETTVDTAAATYAAAYSIGNFYLNVSKSLRITRITVDLAQSQNNLYAALLGSLKPGARIRIVGLPLTTFGYSSADAYVQGWTETYSSDSATITMDCTPADDPVEGLVGDGEYGRVATSSLTLQGIGGGITQTTTSITIARPSAAIPGMSTSSGDYPLNINLNGERITLPAPPSTSTTTTQTFTGVTRGVEPTVARNHNNGEPIDIWHAAAAAF